MGNVSKKEGGQALTNQPPQGQRAELVRQDPFQLLRDPFQLMRDAMGDPWRMFQLSTAGIGRDLGWNVGFDVRETDDAFIFEADMPGIRDEDLEVSVAGNQLQINGKREHEQEKNEGRFHTYERSYGSFSRSFTLPDSADVDKIRSDLKDGVLTLVVPKKPGSTPQRRKIQIGSGAKS